MHPDGDGDAGIDACCNVTGVDAYDDKDSGTNHDIEFELVGTAVFHISYAFIK